MSKSNKQSTKHERRQAKARELARERRFAKALEGCERSEVLQRVLDLLEAGAKGALLIRIAERVDELLRWYENIERPHPYIGALPSILLIDVSEHRHSDIYWQTASECGEFLFAPAVEGVGGRKLIGTVLHQGSDGPWFPRARCGLRWVDLQPSPSRAMAKTCVEVAIALYVEEHLLPYDREVRRHIRRSRRHRAAYRGQLTRLAASHHLQRSTPAHTLTH